MASARCGTSRRRGEAERNVIDAALLGRLVAFLDVERLLRDEERGRDDRCARLEDFGRQGLRVMEIGRLSTCQVFWDQNDDGESESDDVNVGVMVGNHLVEDDGWE